MNTFLQKKSLELLAPAGNADIGIAAIDHGADAVYIGAPRFSARANAGTEIGEIKRLIQYAHLFYARVYVALNTVLTDQEIIEAHDIIREIYDAGADGLIIQDTGLLELNLPPIPLIASTQMHNSTPEKVCFLQEVGFRRVILARELSIPEIAEIRRKTHIELEFFVHGALCVSYSGQCYMSQAVTGRSGNRGVCAQPCRSRYTLLDSHGNKIVSDRFLLSLKDLNLMKSIPDLVAAGISSFKIEGRYKEIDYVKNVTAVYSRVLDDFILKNPEYRRSSSGKSEPAFLPDPDKTFNRGYTRYFNSGTREKIASLDTPKSVGQFVGTVRNVGNGFFRTDCSDLQNGDGLCFFTDQRELAGFRVERIDNTKVFPSSMRNIAEGVRLYRNHNIAFARTLRKPSSRRRIGLELVFSHQGDKVLVLALDEDGNRAEVVRELMYEEPRDLGKASESIEKHLSSSGNSPFRISKLTFSGRTGFYPASVLNSIRRELLEKIEKIRNGNFRRREMPFSKNGAPYPETQLDFRANVYNRRAKEFYERHGADVVEPAFESLQDVMGKEVMRTKYCLRYELDACPKFNRSCRRLKDPLYLEDSHHSYLLKFDCKRCTMSIILQGRR